MTAAPPKQLPALLSITELATLLGLPRHVIRDHADAGRIPTFKVGPKDGIGRQKRQVSLAALREHFPELWDAVMLKAEAYDAALFPANDADDD